MLLKKREKIKNFGIIDISFLQNPDLKPMARLIGIELQRHALDYRIRLKTVSNQLSIPLDTVRKSFLQLRVAGYLGVLKIHNKRGHFDYHYVWSDSSKSQNDWLDFFSSVDFEKVEAVQNKTIPMPEKFPPLSVGPSKFEFIVEKNNVILRREIEQIKNTRLNKQSLKNRYVRSEVISIDDYQEYENFADVKNSVCCTSGQTTKPVKRTTNIKIKTNIKIEPLNQKSDDDKAALKLTENKLISIDFKFDTQVQQSLEVDNRIPSDFISNSLSRCIRHNRKNPPRTTVDFNNWSEKWVLDDWKDHINQPHYLPPSQPMLENWGLDSQYFNLIIKDLALSEDQLIILIRYYHSKFFKSGVLSYCWQSDFHAWIADNFDSLLTMLYQKVA